MAEGDAEPKLPLIFYRTAAGAEPVRDWLRSLPPADRRAIGLDLLRVQHLWPIGKPLCDHIGDGVWEVRAGLEGNRIARVLFCVFAGEIVALNGFIKKDTENARSRDRFGQESNEGVRQMTNIHRGSTLDDLLKEDGAYDELKTIVTKEAVALQLEKAMKERKISKRRMAELMQTSRTQVNRLLNPTDGNVTLASLEKAAAILGRKLRLELA